MTELETSREQAADVSCAKDRVERLANALEALPQVDLQTMHVLSGGMYARTIFIPAGVALVGATHKTDHINICMGDISVTTDEGVKRLNGYHVMQTKAGHKRAGFAHSPTVWTTVCKTDLTDLAEIESELVQEPEKLQTRKGLKGEITCLLQQ